MSDDRSARLNQAIADFLQSDDQSLSEIIANHPDLAEELQSFAADYQLLRKAVSQDDAERVSMVVEESDFRVQLEATLAADPAASEPEEDVSNSLVFDTGDAHNDPTRSLTTGGLESASNSTEADVSTHFPRQFGDYELREQIAFGGMGVVYKAHHRKLDRIVALKMILAGKFAREEDVERFFREARSAGALEHPSIVPVHDVGTIDGQHYYSMGYVEGGSLSEHIADGPLKPDEAAALSKSIAEAVQFAHDGGVVHRDMKPGNVLIDREGLPKITDFGLASREGDTQGVTFTGQVLGTPAWMPPEQASGRHRDVGPTSDVYSIGAILYAMLTGRPPFMAAAPVETLRQVIENDPVSPRVLNPDVPLDVETICLKCLEKESDRRYRSARDLADDLQRFLGREPIHARPVSSVEKTGKWIGRHRLVSGLIATSVCLLVFGATASAYFALEARSRASAERKARQDFQAKEAEASKLAAEKSTLAMEQAESIEELEQNLYVSRLREAQAALDAGDYESASRLLAQDLPVAGKVDRRCFVWRYLNRQLKAVKPNIFLRPDAYENARLIPNPTRSLVIALSRTGLEVIRTNDMRVVFRAGSGSIDEELCDACFVGSDHIAVAAGRGTRPHPISGRYIHHGVKIYRLDEPPFMAKDLPIPASIKPTNGPDAVGVCVAASHDGKLLATGLCDGRIAIVDTASHDFIAVMKPDESGTDESRDVIRLKFSPNDEQLVSICYGRSVEVWDIEKRELTFRHQYKTSDFYRDSTFRSSFWLTDRAAIAFSSDGRHLAVSGNPTDLTIIANNRVNRTLSGHTDAIATLDFVPETHHLVSAGLDRSIRYWNTETGESLPRIGTHSANIGGVVAIPGRGEVLAFGADNRIHTWRLPEDSDVERINTENRPYLVRFQPGTNRLVTVGFSEKHYGTQVLDLTSMRRQPLVQQEHRDSRSIAIDVSPDGDFLAFSTLHSESIEILDRNLNRIQRIKGGDKLWDLSLHPTGNLVATDRRVWDVSSGKVLTTLRGYAPSFTRDGRFLIHGVGETVVFQEILGRDQLGETESTDLPNFRMAAFSRDGRFMAGRLVSEPNDFVVVDLASRSVLFQGSGHYAQVYGLAISPNGETIASVGEDKRLLLWDRQTGRIKSELRGHTGVIRGVDFSPDGDMLATTSWDHTIRLWHATPSNEGMTPLLTHALEDEARYLSKFGLRLEQNEYDQEEALDLSISDTTLPRLAFVPDSIRFTANGLRTSSGGEFQPTTIKKDLRGDFEVTATLDSARIHDHFGSYQAIGFRIDLGNQMKEGFSMRFVVPDKNAEPLLHLLHIYCDRETGQLQQLHHSHRLDGLAGEHHLRMVRTGELIHLFHRTDDESPFGYLRSFQVADDIQSDQGSIRFYAHRWGDAEPPSAVWQSIHVRSNEFSGRPTSQTGENEAGPSHEYKQSSTIESSTP